VQGFISSNGENVSLSEAVIVHFDAEQIPLKDVIAVHLYTHKSTSQHSMRGKYRSAIYTFPENDIRLIDTFIAQLQANFEKKLITQILPFCDFKPSEAQFQNYYLKNPEKPFCKTHIEPKLRLLLDKFSVLVKS